MTTCEQPEMEGEGLDLSSTKGTPSSFKSIPTSSLSVIYAPFTYPLSSLMLLPPLNSLVNIKDKASHLADPIARLGHTSQSQIFLGGTVGNPPSAQETPVEIWPPKDQLRTSFSLKASLKPPVGAVVHSLNTIRTDIVDKVSNLRTDVEGRAHAAREKVTTIKAGVEYQVHSAKEQVNTAVDRACKVPIHCYTSSKDIAREKVTTLKTGVEYQVHSARGQVNTLVSGVQLQVHSAKEQVNAAVDKACKVPLYCYTSSKDIATAYVNLAIVAPFAIYASTKETALTFADHATIYAASFNAAQYALSVSDSGLGKTEMLLGFVPSERVERVQMKVKKVRIAARQVRERARRAARARRNSSEQSEFDPDQKEFLAVSLEIIPGEMADENATFVMVLFVMLVLLMLIVLMTLMLVLEDALENALEEAKMGDAIVDIVGFSYILTLLSFFGISFPDFTHAVKEQEAQAAAREEKRYTRI